MNGAALDASRERGPSLRRRLVVALGSLALAAIVLSSVLVFLMLDIADAFADVRRDERASNDGLMLGVAVREQYIHEAHTLIESTDSHLSHHHTWVEQVRLGARDLEPRVPASEQWRVRRIASTSAEIDRLFRTSLVPAMERGDAVTLAEQHRRVDELVTRASRDADAVTAALERRMYEAQKRTEVATRAALAVASVGAISILLLATLHAFWLRRRALQPLGRLVEATQAIARGEIPAAGEPGDVEIRAVQDALVRLSIDLGEREAQLVAAERMAVVGQLAAGVAHEVNNPIGVIRGYLKTMIPEARDDEQQRELQILDEEAAACQRIAEELVAYARSGELRRRETRIDDLITSTVERLEASGRLAGVRVRTAIQPAEVRLDAQRMRQVLENLLRNAAQASPEGAVIDVEGRADSIGYQVRVCDRGPGVPIADRDQIFEPFFTRKAGGSGLGLAVCLGVVRAHGGTLDVIDRDGGGASFEIVLPTGEAREGS